MQKEAKVFLGGTCNGSQWRGYPEKHLKMPWFNPVVEDWDAQAMEREEYEKASSLYHLYVLTPKMKGCYAVAELINDCHTPGFQTYFCYLEEDEGLRFEAHQLKAMKAIADMVEKIGGVYKPSLEETVQALNQVYQEKH